MANGRLLAIIDVGSNSIRLLVARALSESAFEVVDEEQFDARLAEGLGESGLSPEAFERGVSALQVIAAVAASYGPAAVIAAGTEALRRASNASQFVRRVSAETGIQVRVLSAREEAYASYLGVINSTGLVDGAILDIGGGSMEVMDVAGRALLSSHSAPLGALAARDRFFKSDPPRLRDIRALRKTVRTELGPREPVQALVGVGGAVRNLARIVRLRRRYPLRRLHGLELARKEVQRLASQLSSATTEQRRRIPGVSAARADSLHVAAVVVDEAMAVLGADTLFVSGQGLREGLLWTELRSGSPILADVREASAAGLAAANGVDPIATEPVVAAAAAIAEAVASRTSLKSSDRALLLTAARLAGIGMHIDYYNRDRHAEYLVHSGDLHGFTHREIVLLAALVRCADSGSLDVTGFAGLVRNDDVTRLQPAAAILGLARAVRRRTPSPVHRLEARLEGDRLVLRLTANAPLDAEYAAIERQRRRAEASLGLTLQVETIQRPGAAQPVGGATPAGTPRAQPWLLP